MSDRAWWLVQYCLFVALGVSDALERMEHIYWLDPRNWRSVGNTVATPHAERIPCDYGNVQIPNTNSTFIVLPPKPIKLRIFRFGFRVSIGILSVIGVIRKFDQAIEKIYLTQGWNFSRFFSSPACLLKIISLSCWKWFFFVTMQSRLWNLGDWKKNFFQWFQKRYDFWNTKYFTKNDSGIPKILEITSKFESND